jgi:hypothetical protein
MLYQYGQGVPQSYTQAAAWFRKAAEQGMADAEFHLGTLYERGNGVPQDYAQTVSWYQKAAEQGQFFAQFLLGRLYLDGKGVPQSYGEAYFWLSLAASRMNGPDEATVAELRDEAAAKLTPEELSKAQERAAEWFAAHPPRP